MHFRLTRKNRLSGVFRDLGSCHLYVSVYIERTVKNSENIHNILSIPPQVHYAVVAEQYYSYFTFFFSTIHITDFRELPEYLYFFIDTFYNLNGSTWVIGRYIFRICREARFQPQMSTLFLPRSDPMFHSFI